MTKSILFSISTVVLIGLLVYQTHRVGVLAQERETTEAAKKKEEAKRDATYKSDMAFLQLQKTCAEQGQKEFDLEIGQDKKLAGFESNYNLEYKKCFVLVHNTSIYKGIPSVSQTLVDPFTGHVYGQYLWMNLEKKKFWEVAPTDCSVRLPGESEEKVCKSEAEFKGRVTPVMGDEGLE